MVIHAGLRFTLSQQKPYMSGCCTAWFCSLRWLSWEAGWRSQQNSQNLAFVPNAYLGRNQLEEVTRFYFPLTQRFYFIHKKKSRCSHRPSNKRAAEADFSWGRHSKSLRVGKFSHDCDSCPLRSSPHFVPKLQVPLAWASHQIGFMCVRGNYW